MLLAIHTNVGWDILKHLARQHALMAMLAMCWTYYARSTRHMKAVCVCVGRVENEKKKKEQPCKFGNHENELQHSDLMDVGGSGKRKAELPHRKEIPRSLFFFLPVTSETSRPERKDSSTEKWRRINNDHFLAVKNYQLATLERNDGDFFIYLLMELLLFLFSFSGAPILPADFVG